ncbi:hypothetical protein [Tessaracoccus rhinocerotis]|uniref:hypothetical protein n=1 Tax=Tessaracoccus rhinocerotis TaxID=1689449 RepID=UPI001C8F9348|nr:hypothetical protein [Tessaracoccus rhinocerotis]
MLLDGPVEIAGADAGAGDDTVHMAGMFFSLLGTAEHETLRRWFDALADGGEVIDPCRSAHGETTTAPSLTGSGSAG